MLRMAWLAAKLKLCYGFVNLLLLPGSHTVKDKLIIERIQHIYSHYNLK